MVDKGRVPTHSERLRDFAERLAVTFGARALWALVVQLLDHHAGGL